MVLLDGGDVVGNAATPRVLGDSVIRTLVEEEKENEDDVLIGMTPSLVPVFRGLSAVVLV